MSSQHVAIIGGGITGLTAAYRLLQSAKDRETPLQITLFEASSRLGGKIITYREDGLTLEGGPDSMLARKLAGPRLLKELGLESEIVSTNAKAAQTYIVRHGMLEPMPQGTFMGIPADISKFMGNHILSSQGKLRALFDLFIGKSNLANDVSLGKFLRARLGDEWVDELAEPLLAGIYAGQIDTLSLQSTWPQLVNLAQSYRSLVIGARATQKLSPTPSAQSGRSAFISVRGGLFTIIERLADTISDEVSIHLRQRVTNITKRLGGGYQLAVNDGAQTASVEADAVILCTPVALMQRLLGAYLPGPSQSFEVPYASTATVILGYPSSHVDVDLSRASGFLVPRSENRAITASTWVSSKWPHAGREDYVLLRCYVGRQGQTKHLELDDKEMVRAVQQDVLDIVGIHTSPLFHKVTRWNDSMPNYPVGHQEAVNQLEADLQTSLPGVYVAGAGYRGLGIPDCIAQGERSAADVFEYLDKR